MRTVSRTTASIIHLEIGLIGLAFLNTKAGSEVIVLRGVAVSFDREAAD